jgi:predicted Zn-dependent protease
MDRRLVVVLFSFVTVLSCSTTSGPGGEAAGVAGDLILPPSQEEQLGERFSQQIEQELELHQDPKVQAYLQALGESAVRAAGDDVSDPIEFEFHVIDKPDTMNAFAGPGGQIYFFSGLLREADNAAEVMGVMAHEVAHVSKRHVSWENGRRRDPKGGHFRPRFSNVQVLEGDSAGARGSFYRSNPVGTVVLE